jgi:NitT/TauT family transport system substrate-binding protein
MKATHLLRTGLVALTLALGAGIAHAEKLTVGYLPVTGHAKFFVAQEQGFFKQEGLEVDLVEFVNSADGLHAVVSNKLDIGAFGTTAPLVHYARGADLKIIGGIMGEDAAIIVKPENAPGIRSIADLKGKKIATIRLATGDAVLRGSLTDAGIAWKTDTQIFELKNPPAVIEAVKSGQVDAGVVWGPHDIRAERQGLEVVIRSGALQPGHPCCRLVVKSDKLNNPVTLERFLRAILRAEQFASTHRTETIDAIQKYVKLDRDILEAGYYSPHLEQGTDANVQGTRKFWDTLLNSEFVDTARPLEPIFALDIYERALQSLAAENPADPFWQNLLQTAAARNAP